MNLSQPDQYPIAAAFVLGAPRGAFLLLKWREPLYRFRVKLLILLLSAATLLVLAQTEPRQLYVQVSLSGEQMAALTNATAIINMERTGESGSPWVTPDAVFMTITIQEINAVCERLISTDPKAIVRRFNRKD